MKKDVCDRAAEIETGCVNQSPLDVAEICVTCGLHMDCNEFLRALEHIIKQCALLSLHLYPDKTFVLQSGNSSSARGGRNNVVVSDISILPEASPLIQATRVLEDGRLPKLAAFFRKRFTPAPDESSRVEQYLDLDGCGEDLFDLLEDLFDLQCGQSATPANDKASRNSRIRLIGEHVRKLAPIFSSLCRSLKFPAGIEETPRFLCARIVCCTYVHLLKCMSSLYAEWILRVNFDDKGSFLLGDVFVRLVHRFALHRSANTSLLAQISPLLISFFKETYMVNSTYMLGLGVLGRNEGGGAWQSSSETTAKEMDIRSI